MPYNPDLTAAEREAKAKELADLVRAMEVADAVVRGGRQQHIPSFREFVAKVNKRFIFYPHCDLLANICERVTSGELKRVMIQLPPRHSKSELFSRLFSAYYLFRNPSHFVGINSYSAELAYTLSRAARDNYTEMGAKVKSDAAAVKHWETPEGGGMWAAGVGGSITGKGGHLLLIDDPLKNSEEANSEIIREKHKEWYSSTFYTRQEPNAAIVVIQTRWHEDDLTGWLLSEELESEEPERWHVVCLPAVAEDVPVIPSTCSLEPDTRLVGEALCPERYDANKLSKIRARIGEYHFGALYQQRPTSKEGLLFHVDKLEIVKASPIDAFRCRGWDKASISGGGDWSVGIRVAKGYDGIYYIEDVVRGQWDTATRDRIIRQTAELDGKHCKQIGEQEPGSGGKESAQAFVRLLAGFSVSTETSTKNKEERADPLSSQVNAGNVRIVKGDWNRQFLEEFRTFPHGKYDDQIDATSLAFNKISRRFHTERKTLDERIIANMPENLHPENLARMSGREREKAHYLLLAEWAKAERKVQAANDTKNRLEQWEWK